MRLYAENTLKVSNDDYSPFRIEAREGIALGYR